MSIYGIDFLVDCWGLGGKHRCYMDSAMAAAVGLEDVVRTLVIDGVLNFRYSSSKCFESWSEHIQEEGQALLTQSWQCQPDSRALY